MLKIILRDKKILIVIGIIIICSIAIAVRDICSNYKY